MTAMTTILGAGGPIGNELAKILSARKTPFRLVSRNPKPAAGGALFPADLADREQTVRAVAGSSVVHLLSGLKYNLGVWQELWPRIMANTIEACKRAEAKLIFFDNVYMYGLVDGPMTEDTPYNPCSAKGEVRAGIATKLMDEAKAGNIKASIARAADFYGTENKNSFFDMMVLDNYAKKARAQWLGNPSKLHNFSYIPDMGKGMYLLGQNSTSDNQVWHMPTQQALLGKQFIEIAAGIYKVEPKYFAINKFLLWSYGLFNKQVMGTVEMYYQYNHDYIFDSSKFEKAFNFKPATYEDGIKYSSQTLYIAS